MSVKLQHSTVSRNGYAPLAWVWEAQGPQRPRRALKEPLGEPLAVRAIADRPWHVRAEHVRRCGFHSFYNFLFACLPIFFGFSFEKYLIPLLLIKMATAYLGLEANTVNAGEGELASAKNNLSFITN